MRVGLTVPTPVHIPVLPREVLATLVPQAGETYADGTAGLGGHAKAIAEAMKSAGGAGTIVLNDVDPKNLAFACEYVQQYGEGSTVVCVQGNFAELPHTLRAKGLAANMLLADLGFSSNQLEDAARGMSFMRDGALDMRLDPTLPVSASDLVNTLSEGELARILLEFGEEHGARRIARKLVESRAQNPIVSSGQLAELVRAALPSGHGPIDPATKTFQALRIAVNDELGSLEGLLGLIEQAAAQVQCGTPKWLARGARVAIISFHSLEDRLVKHAFARMVKSGVAEDITNGPVVASENELASNPRARSAKLRVVRLLGDNAKKTENSPQRHKEHKENRSK